MVVVYSVRVGGRAKGVGVLRCVQLAHRMGGIAQREFSGSLNPRP